ncbi:hypothetical protein [Streptomyces sp. NPDC127039]|uniref:hypothetical protein n=1 Tax=Streptomyces sp. NPDC127039 TaxID=3347115 RepID=UPI00364DED07
MTSILAHLTAIGSTRPVLALHADRSPADHALRTETGDLVGQLPGARAAFWYERPGREEPDAREGPRSSTPSNCPRAPRCSSAVRCRSCRTAAYDNCAPRSRHSASATRCRTLDTHLGDPKRSSAGGGMRPV